MFFEKTSKHLAISVIISYYEEDQYVFNLYYEVRHADINETQK